jgi:hypothetical protein
MNRKDIEGIINAQNEFQFGGIVASDRSDNAKDDSSPGGNKSGTRCDGDETSYRS